MCNINFTKISQEATGIALYKNMYRMSPAFDEITWLWQSPVSGDTI